MHTAASVHQAHLPVRSDPRAGPDLAGDHPPNLDCHLDTVDEALDCLGRRWKSYFVRPADL